MGMPFSQYWVKARDALLEVGKTQPRLSYAEFAAICAQHTLTAVATRTLAALMHDLGYIVYYGDDERLKDDVVLQPEWLTKAIGFVLEDRTTAELAGILPDRRLREVWLQHPFHNEPRYDADLYPFFLRLMEKYDVSYRLESGDANLVAQHVPQVRPTLPWLPEARPAPGHRRIAMVCVMEDNPPGLVPWMIVRTHDYAVHRTNAAEEEQRLHWQKGMFLRYKGHGEAMIELQGRELHLYTQAAYPEYFMNVLRQTLYKLITDNWPGMQGHYRFTVPCREQREGAPCPGRFDIEALSQFLNEGDRTIRCQECYTRQDIEALLFGFAVEDSRIQLTRIETKMDEGFAEVRDGISELESRIANTFWALMQAIAAEAKEGPRLYTLRPSDELSLKQLFNRRYELQLWCEADGEQHRVRETGKGVYALDMTRDWVNTVAPYLNFAVRVLKTVVPMVTPAIDSYFGTDTIKNVGIGDELKFAEQVVKTMGKEIQVTHGPEARSGALSEVERAGLLALHRFLKEKDPTQARLGLHRMPTYTGDFRWLCQYHYEQAQSKIPTRIE